MQSYLTSSRTSFGTGSLRDDADEQTVAHLAAGRAGFEITVVLRSRLNATVIWLTP